MVKKYNIRTTPINRVDHTVNIINNDCVRELQITISQSFENIVNFLDRENIIKHEQPSKIKNKKKYYEPLD